jgi:hypothetical protein
MKKEGRKEEDEEEEEEEDAEGIWNIFNRLRSRVT